MQGTSAIAPAVSSARPIAAVAWRGLVQVLVGSDLSPRGRWRSPWQRRAGGTVLGAATLLLCVASVASLYNGQGLLLVAGSPHGRVSVRTAHQPATAIGHGHPPVPFGGPGLPRLLAVGGGGPRALADRYPLLGRRIGWVWRRLVPRPHLACGRGVPGAPR